MKYYIIAGEASGDLHGSNLMKGIYAEDPDAQIRFWGGDCMQSVWNSFQNRATPLAAEGGAHSEEWEGLFQKWSVLFSEMVIRPEPPSCSLRIYATCR